MKIAVSLVLLLSTVYSSPVENKRHYDPKEEDPYRMKYLLWQDEDGKYRYENLLEEQPSTRADVSDVKYYLYTRDNLDNPDVMPGDGINYLASSNYNQNRINVFLIHGWNNNYQSAVNTNIRPAILSNYDVNLFVVDWSSITDGLYTVSFFAVPTIGEIVGDFIYSIMGTYGQSSSDFYLIGHSLGAHVSGCAGAQIINLSGSLVNSIVGLDPAGPLFSTGNIDNRLDRTDADFVHVIHTNGGLLGFSSSIGNVDFYPNGGSNQPGCGIDLVGTCAHSRSYYIYAESVISSGFLAHKCDSSSSYNDGKCYNNGQTYMGQFIVDKSISGDFHLNTNSESPFALG